MIFSKTIDKKLFIISIITLSFFLIFCFCLALFVDFSYIKEIAPSEFDDNNIVKFNIDNIDNNSEYLTISGWAFIEFESTTEFDFDIVLKNMKTNKYIVIPTVLVNRSDLNDVFDDGTDYSNSGFFSKVSKSQINYENNSFEIYLKYSNNLRNLFVKTNVTLKNGKE